MIKQEYIARDGGPDRDTTNMHTQGFRTELSRRGDDIPDEGQP